MPKKLRYVGLDVHAAMIAVVAAAVPDLERRKRLRIKATFEGDNV